MLKAIVAKNIKEFRLKRGLSQSDLAELIGYTNYGAINRWENQKAEPTLDVLDKIAEALKVDPRALFVASDKEGFTLIPNWVARKAQMIWDGIAAINPNAEPCPPELRVGNLTYYQQGQLLIDQVTVLTDLAVSADGTIVSEKTSQFDPLSFAKRLFL